jgi:hypothetical protein
MKSRDIPGMLGVAMIKTSGNVCAALGRNRAIDKFRGICSKGIRTRGEVEMNSSSDVLVVSKLLVSRNILLQALLGSGFIH